MSKEIEHTLCMVTSRVVYWRMADSKCQDDMFLDIVMHEVLYLLYTHTQTYIYLVGFSGPHIYSLKINNSKYIVQQQQSCIL